MDGGIKSEEASWTDTEWKNILEPTGLVQFRKNKEVNVMETVRENESGRRKGPRGAGCLPCLTLKLMVRIVNFIPRDKGNC